MKKIKLALMMAGLVGISSLQLQAQEFNLENYSSLSEVQKEENFQEVIVTLEEGYTLQDLKNRGLNFKEISGLGLGSTLIVVNNQYNIEDYISNYQEVKFANLNKTIVVKKYDNMANQKTFQPLNSTLFNDPLYDRQEYFQDVEVFNFAASIERAIENKKEQNVKMRIGIVDTGTGTHSVSDLSFTEDQSLVVEEAGRSQNGLDFTDSTFITDGCMEADGHGTAMAYVIGANSNNNVGGIGVIDADIVMARSATTTCNAMGGEVKTTLDLDDVVRSINWLSGEPINGIEGISESVDIINLSLGNNVEYLDPPTNTMPITVPCFSILQTSIDNAISKGIVVIAAAGNSNEDVIHVAPANCNNIITVGAHNETTGKEFFSNFGEEVDLTAIGENILTMLPDPVNPISGTTYFVDNESGTSYSAAITSGVVGLIKEKYPVLNQQQAELLLERGAVENTVCNTNECGAGMLNAYNSMVMADQFFGFEFSPTHYYAERNSCEDTIYLSRMNQLTPVCDLYNIEVSHPESFVAVDYQIVKRDIFENRWTEENTQIVATVTAEEGVRVVTHLLRENDSDFTYAIRSCTVEGECIEYKELDLSQVVKPAFCTEN